MRVERLKGLTICSSPRCQDAVWTVPTHKYLSVAAGGQDLADLIDFLGATPEWNA